MSALTVIILGAILLFVFGINMIRKSKLTIMKEALNAKNYDAVIATAQGSMSRRLCTPYVCDLYTLRASFFQLDEASFLEKLKEIVYGTVDKVNQQDFLETYLHIFISKENQNAANQVLSLIMECGTANLKEVSKFAYDIVFLKRSDDVKLIESNLEKYRGFDIGIAALYLGKYYELTDDIIKASEFYDSSIGCFDPNHYYAKYAKEKAIELEEQIVEE